MRVALAAIAIALVVSATACTDLREFRGTWHGRRIGDAPAVKVGIPDAAEAQLAIDALDEHGLSGTLTIPGLVAETPILSIEGAEADKLATLTFSGSPLRVYLAFAPVADGAGDALALIALYTDDRVELRILRGGTRPLYGIFGLNQ